MEAVIWKGIKLNVTGLDLTSLVDWCVFFPVLYEREDCLFECSFTVVGEVPQVQHFGVLAAGRSVFGIFHFRFRYCWKEILIKLMATFLLL